MFARFTRLPLRRCIHTRNTALHSANLYGRTTKVVLAASAATATYLTWRLTQGRNQIALDSEPGAANATQSTAKVRGLQTSSAPKTPSLQHPDSSPTDTSFLSDTEQGKVSVPNTSKEEDSSDEPSASSGGAFNPQTGEINWDCPCLGGMAHGPCGPEFREAFSCFVFSEVEPKGMDCVEKFKAMQTCFRAHPEVYADEIMDDDDDEEPASAENSEDLPLPEQSSETVMASTTKKTHLQKVAKDS